MGKRKKPLVKPKKAVSGPRGRPFKPGHSIKSPGRPRIPDEVKALRKMSSDQVAHAGTVILKATRAELKAIVRDPETPMVLAHLAKLILYSYENDSSSNLELLFNRVIGGVQQFQKNEVTGFMGSINYSNLSPSEIQDRLAKVKARIEARQGKAPVAPPEETKDGTGARAGATSKPTDPLQKE